MNLDFFWGKVIHITYLDDLHAGGGGGQPSWSLPLAGVFLSDLQQPNSVSSQGSTGQPSFLGPVAGETPSGQQPNLDSLQVLGVGQAVQFFFIFLIYSEDGIEFSLI